MEKRRTDTLILAKAMDILAVDIQSDDEVANEAIREAANRLRELNNHIKLLTKVTGDQDTQDPIDG